MHQHSEKNILPAFHLEQEFFRILYEFDKSENRSSDYLRQLFKLDKFLWHLEGSSSEYRFSPKLKFLDWILCGLPKRTQF